MKIEKELYLAPTLIVTPLCVESFICTSNLVARITESEEEDDENEWTEIN